jgi:hypothetical protein
LEVVAQAGQDQEISVLHSLVALYQVQHVMHQQIEVVVVQIAAALQQQVVQVVRAMLSFAMHITIHQ